MSQVFDWTNLGNAAQQVARLRLSNQGVAQLTGADAFPIDALTDAMIAELFAAWSTGAGQAYPSAQFTNVVVGPAAAQVGSTINVMCALEDLSANPASTNLVDLEFRVSDGLLDWEPSATATLDLGTTGSILSGGGTATATYRTSSSGLVSVAVTETTPAAHRFLWVRAGGNTQKYVKSKLGVFELVYS